VGRFLEWLGVPHSSLPLFCRRPVEVGCAPAATTPPPPPPPPGPTAPLNAEALAPPPVLAQPPSLPPMIVPSEGGFYHRWVL
jgi:hypothetical protein